MEHGHLPNIPARPVSIWRRTLGFLLLGLTVFMWTFSNFIFSFLFADFTYPKPLFVTYINTASFLTTLPLVLCFTSRNDKAVWRSQLSSWDWRAALTTWARSWLQIFRIGRNDESTRVSRSRDRSHRENEALISRSHANSISSKLSRESQLTFPETVVFALKFSVLWVFANYFTAACFQSTTVASGTAIVATSSLWTLLMSRLLRVEQIHWQKVVGVVLSLLGVLLILGDDLFGDPGDNRGSFPVKSRYEIAVGSALALASAIMYGVYGTFAKRSIGDEAHANMPLIFGLVGMFNTIGLIPLLLIWHYTGIEPFELPPSRYVVLELIVNAIVSVLSDLAWFYAVLVTSPVIVTVVLSLTIPLSLIGQILAHDQYATSLNFLGSILVTIACILVNLDWNRDELVDHQASYAASP